MKRILIVSRSFYPENSPRAFRTTELAKELVRQGNSVTVLTPHRSEHKALQKEFANLHFIDLGALSWTDISTEGSGVVRLVRRVLRRGFKWFVEYPDIQWYFKVKKKLKRFEAETYDMLISIAVPYAVHWGVAAVWKQHSEANIAKIWVADCGDPFMGAENDSVKPPFYFKYVEKWFSRKADFLTVPVETAIQAYYPEFHSKIHVISQGFRFEDIKTAPFEASTMPRFAYAGSLIPGRRDPKTLFEFLVKYPRPYQFDVYTKNTGLIQDYVNRSQGRIRIKDYVPREVLLYELSKLDFLVNFENAGQKQIPSKIIDYVILDKPILSVNSFETDLAVVQEFLEGNYDNRLSIDHPEQYKIENVAKKFLHLASD